MTPARFSARRFAPLVMSCLLIGVSPADSQSLADNGPAASLLTAAERRARGGDLGGALEDYEQLIRQFPDSPQAPQAMLRIAQGQLSGGNRSAAFTTVERLVTTYPRAPDAAGGLLLEGRMRSELPEQVEDLEDARKTLEKTWLLFPRSAYPVLPARSAARVLNGEIALRLQRNEEATSSFLEALETEPVSPSTADALIGLAAAFIRGGEWQAAAESLQDALGVPDAVPSSSARARRRLALLDRRLLRPHTGGTFWTSARSLRVSGAPLKRAAGVAADDEGRLLILDAGSDVLLLVSPSGAVKKRWTLRNGEKPSWGPRSSVQVAARDSIIMPGEGNLSFRVPGKEKTLDGIRAVERDPFGRWIVLASRANGVLSYHAGRGSGRPILRGDGDPVDLTVDALDHLYILEKKGRRVLRVNQHDNSRAVVASGAWKQPVAVAVDPIGFVHVLDGGTGRIHTYDNHGQEVGAVGPKLPGGIELRKATDIAVAGDGRLYIVDARAGLVILE